MGSLKYYPTSNDERSAKQRYTDANQAFKSSQWSNTATIETIEMESSFGSETFEEVDVQLVHAISSETGLKLGDDFKKIIFEDKSSGPIIGKRYRFADNIWITINTKNTLFYNDSSTIQRANTTSNWLLEDGTIHKEPTVLGYKISDNGIDYNKKLDNHTGEMSAYLQFNDFTKSLKVGDSFIYGKDGGAEKWIIRALNNSLYQNTFDENPKLIEINMEAGEINKDRDDAINRVTDINVEYSISIDQEDILQNIGYTTTLTATVKLDDEVVNRNIVWSSSDELVATIDSSSGDLTILSNGTTNISCQLGSNVSIFDIVTVEGSTLPIDNYVIRYNPSNLRVLQGSDETYTVELYNNNILLLDNFVFSEINGVPLDNYDLEIIDGNNFLIRNIEQYNENLIIRCVSGIHTEDIEITLGGAW